MEFELELWSLDATIYEVVAEEVWEEDYVNDGEGGLCLPYRTWEELDESKIASVEIPYIGEEDEINPKILIPAIQDFLEDNKYLVNGSYIEEDQGGLSFTAYYDSNQCPYLRVRLG